MPRAKTQTEKSQQLARTLKLSPAQMKKLTDDPDLFIENFLKLVRANHLNEADDILKALEAKAKKGDVKAAECWLRFIGSQKANTDRQPKSAPSKQVKKAVGWLPDVTVDATPVEESVKLLQR